jgi:hypothetical protein
MGFNGRRYFEANFDHEMLVDELVAHLQAESKKNGDRR